MIITNELFTVITNAFESNYPARQLRYLLMNSTNINLITNPELLFNLLTGNNDWPVAKCMMRLFWFKP